MSIAKFRKKPVVIEAAQWLPENEDAIRTWVGNMYKCPDFGGNIVWHIPTMEGSMDVIRGSWVIKGVKGEFYPCKDDIFRRTYEPVVSEYNAMDYDRLVNKGEE